MAGTRTGTAAPAANDNVVVETNGALVGRFTNYVERVKDLEQKNKALIGETQQMTRQVTELKGEVDKRAKEVEAIKRQANEKLIRARGEWKSQAEAYGRKMSQDAEARCLSEVTYLKDLVQRQEEQIKAVKAELKKAEAGKEEKEKDKRTLEHRLESLQDSTKDEMMLLKQEVARLNDFQKRWEESKATIEGLQSESTKLKAEVTRLKGEKEQASERIKQLTGADTGRAKLAKEVEELQTIIEGLNEELEELGADKEEQAKKSKAMAQELQRVQAEQKKTEAEVRKLREANTRLDKELESVASTGQTAKGEAEALEAQIKDLECKANEVEGLREKVSTLEKELVMYRTLAAASKDKQFALLYIRDIDTAQGHLCVENRSNMDVSLAGWRLLAEETGATFDFPEDSVLGATSKATVWWGPQNTKRDRLANHFFWTGSDKAEIWAAEEDTAKLEDMEGRLMSSMKVLPNRRRERSPAASPTLKKKMRRSSGFMLFGGGGGAASSSCTC